MTILQLSTSSGPGGAERMISSLAEALHRDGTRVMVGLFRPGWLKTECEQRGVETSLDGHLADQIRQDIRDFKARNNCDRLVMIWAASTEIFMEEQSSHMNLEDFEAAIERVNVPMEMPQFQYATL